MEKLKLKVLTLAAAVIAPHLIALDTKAVQVKRIDELSVAERLAIKEVSEIAVYRKEEKAIKL